MSDEKRIKELENSLSIALEINDKYQRKNKELIESNEKLENNRPLDTMDEVAYHELKSELARAKENHQYDNLVHAEELRKALKK